MQHDDGPGGGLIDPLAMVSLATLVVNDHVLKAAARSTPWAVVTGKLSDVAGMVFFPILVVAGLELWQRWRSSYEGPQLRQAIAVAAVVAVVFAAINVSDDAGIVYAWSLAVLQWPFRAGLAWLSSSSLPALRPVVHVVDPADALTVVGAVYVVWQTRWRARASRLRRG